jgi:hypothetical protein
MNRRDLLIGALATGTTLALPAVAETTKPLIESDDAFFDRIRPLQLGVLETLEHYASKESDEIYYQAIFQHDIFIASCAKHTISLEPGESYYKIRKTFPTKGMGIEFVKKLYPELIYAQIRSGDKQSDSIKSGYRGAIRVMFRDEIIQTDYEIVHDDTKEHVLISDMPLWDIGRAWACLENIRVNGKPVSRPAVGSSHLPEYLLQPFRKGNPEIEYI